MRHAGGRNRDQPVSHLLLFPHPDADFFRHNAVRYHFPESDAVPVFPAPQPLPGRLLKICLSTLRREPISVGDMLYAFYHHPDQYVLMFLIINGISSVIALISSIPGFQYLSSPGAELTLGTALSIDAELSSLMNVYVYKLIGSLVSTLVLVPFSLSTFVMNDAPGIGPIQAIRQSFVLMKKNFFRYILLLLSFLGLEILASCSCAIGFLWVMPYMQITMAAFYQERKDILYPASEPVGYDTDSFGSGTDL